MKRFGSRGFPYHRGRRLRSFKNLREILSENQLSVNNLVMPYFVREDNDSELVDKSSGLKRLTVFELTKEIEKIVKNGVKTVALFPIVSKEKKTENAKESYNKDNLICRALKKIHAEFPNLIVICDIALDAYTLSGHDGVVNKDGKIDNDATLDILSKMSLNFASSGCKIIAPSDMMDGRIKVIRESLESNNFSETCILSYSSKFCSNFYSPFREVLGSKKNLGDSSKETYQIDFRNSREALKESLEDIYEGCDILMVKPAGYYLDIIKEIKDNSLIPVAAYQVSGEYCMIKAAADKNLLDLEKVVIESLTCIKRSGADLIFSYFSDIVAEWIKR